MSLCLCLLQQQQQARKALEAKEARVREAERAVKEEEGCMMGMPSTTFSCMESMELTGMDGNRLW